MSSRQAGNSALFTTYSEAAQYRLYQGDGLHVLPTLNPGSVDSLITDPPYCSGGTTARERSRPPEDKYCQDGNLAGRPTFEGDCRDQRSFVAWCAMWMSLSRRAVRPGGYAMIFTDWRQLPAMTDALQAAGWIWRGIVPWDKGRGARSPHKGYFRHQCEYVLWGTNGRCEHAVEVGPLDGCIQESVRRDDKHHVTGKPTELMKRLVARVPAGQTILDPFAGSCSTGVAALLTGYRFVGIEQSLEYCEIGSKRLAAASRGELLAAAKGLPNSPCAAALAA